MNCIKCGKKLQKNEKFCTNCGTYNDENDIDFEGENSNIEEEKNSDVFDELDVSYEEYEEEFTYEDEVYVEAYVGEDYKVIRKMPFNIYAFLLNWIYVLYRKLYITGIIGLGVSLFFFLLFKSYILIYLIINMLLLGFFFNKYYIFVIKRRIAKIKNEYDQIDRFTLVNACKERGGVNILYSLVIYAVFLVVLILCLSTLKFNRNHNTKFFKENSENKATCISLVKMSYNNLKDNYELGNIEQAVCKKINSKSTNYEIYLKTKKEKLEIYVYYLGKDGYLTYQTDTDLIKQLEEKKEVYELTKEEEKMLNTALKSQENYMNIFKKSQAEDLLIKNKKNSKEKVNYVFEREEIIQ